MTVSQSQLHSQPTTYPSDLHSLHSLTPSIRSGLRWSLWRWGTRTLTVRSELTWYIYNYLVWHLWGRCLLRYNWDLRLHVKSWYICSLRIQVSFRLRWCISFLFIYGESCFILSWLLNIAVSQRILFKSHCLLDMGKLASRNYCWFWLISWFFIVEFWRLLIQICHYNYLLNQHERIPKDLKDCASQSWRIWNQSIN